MHGGSSALQGVSIRSVPFQRYYLSCVSRPLVKPWQSRLFGPFLSFRHLPDRWGEKKQHKISLWSRARDEEEEESEIGGRSLLIDARSWVAGRPLPTRMEGVSSRREEESIRAAPQTNHRASTFVPLLPTPIKSSGRPFSCHVSPPPPIFNSTFES